MSGTTISRRVMLGQCVTAVFAIAAGCTGDDSTEDTAADSGTMPTTGDGTAPGTTDGDSGQTQTTGDSGGTSTGANTTSGSTGPADGSTSDTGPGDSTTGSASACEGMIVATISNNHGHTLEIPLADIEAGVEVAYDATGAAGHCHEVIVTAEDFATLRDGGVVTKYSCNGGDHQYVLSCAAGAPDPVAPPECGGTGDNFGQCP